MTEVEQAPEQAPERPEKIVHENLMSALSAVQGELPVVRKSKTARVKSQRTGAEYRYSYADLADVHRQLFPLLSRHGLAWTTKPSKDEQGDPILLCKLIHGATGETEVCEVPLIVTAPDVQSYGSALTYARRYGVSCVCGVVTDEDDDGNLAVGNTTTTAASLPPVIPGQDQDEERQERLRVAELFGALRANSPGLLNEFVYWAQERHVKALSDVPAQALPEFVAKLTELTTRGENGHPTPDPEPVAAAEEPSGPTQ